MEILLTTPNHAHYSQTKRHSIQHEGVFYVLVLYFWSRNVNTSIALLLQKNLLFR